jgi:hypothetical protein
MKSQKHNTGELKTLTVEIESKVVEHFEKMAEKSNLPLDELVVIALKRFRASHSDYMESEPHLD